MGNMGVMRNRAILIFAILLATVCMAADTVLVWPKTGEPSLQFKVGKLRQMNSYSGQTDYVADTTVTNLGQKAIPFASFYVYLFDKNHNRIGEGYLELSNVAPGQQAKVALTAHAMGSVASMDIEAQHVGSDEPKKVPMLIATVPAGASVKVDGQDAGVTPAKLELLPGKHTVEFAKEGYAAGSAPVEVTPGALPGTVNFEMEPLVQDTVVLRDGKVVLGDVTSVTMTSVSLRVGGKIRRFNRNDVARVVFVERKVVKRPVKRK